MRFSDSHERTISAPEDQVWSLVAALGTDDDRLWPAGFPAFRLHGPLAPGAEAEHWSVRHVCQAVERGRSVEWSFSVDGIHGHHRFLVGPGAGGGTQLRHELEGTAPPEGVERWRSTIQPLHAAVIEGVLDGAERAVAGTAP
jgi:hypothetical protein